MNEEIFLTKEGIEEIRAELADLKEIKRPEIAAKLKAAIEMGDLSENADYIKAKEDQGFLEGKIQELEAILKLAKVIETDIGYSEKISIGATVVVKEEGYPEETIQIVGSKEADPSSGKLSYDSPIGSALLNHKPGDIIRVRTPGGSTNFKIIEIK